VQSEHSDGHQRESGGHIAETYGLQSSTSCRSSVLTSSGISCGNIAAAMQLCQQIAHVLSRSTSGTGYGCRVQKVVLNVAPAPTTELQPLSIARLEIVESQLLRDPGKRVVIAIL
jgi:hypothetical protein